MIRPAVALTALALALAVSRVETAGAHYRPGTHNAVHAIQQAWCGRANRGCWQGNEAIAVARCESHLYQYARSPGGHLGIFQFGAYARRTYGFGWDPWSQAFAARRMFRVEGWAPWSCARILGIR